MRTSVWISVAWILMPMVAFAQQADADARRVAMAYLDATTGEGSDSGRQLLLGGVSMDASIFNLENGKILSIEPLRKESGDLATARKFVAKLDHSAKASLEKTNERVAAGDELTVVELTKEEADALSQPTANAAKKLKATYPVLAYALRVGKNVYWHPKNPMRPVLADAGNSGKYRIELQRFVIESHEGPSRQIRKWGLKIVRFQSPGVDTGWKVLPASDWEPE